MVVSSPCVVAYRERGFYDLNYLKFKRNHVIVRHQEATFLRLIDYLV
jgi:hypothetical protein